jgi:preprotein translocase subunit SecB
MNANVQKKLRFNGYKIYGFNLSSSDEKDPLLDENLSLDISLSSKINTETNKGFNLVMNIILVSSDKKFELILNSKSMFETDIEIDDSYLGDPMVNINAPAIVFPFLRAFINTVTINAGFKPIILPAINFAKMYNDAMAKGSKKE